MLARTLYRVDDLSASSAQAVPIAPEEDTARANCVGSLLADGSGLHAPALDIDLPCELVESSTPGHFHFYIDKPMPWPQYVRLLLALADAGILEVGYVEASLRDGATILRRPGVRKAAA